MFAEWPRVPVRCVVVVAHRRSGGSITADGFVSAVPVPVGWVSRWKRVAWRMRPWAAAAQRISYWLKFCFFFTTMMKLALLPILVRRILRLETATATVKFLECSLVEAS